MGLLSVAAGRLNFVKAKFSLPITVVLRTYPRKGHDTNRYYQGLMYSGLRAADTLHKKPCRIGLGLCGTSENTYSTHSGE